jgi:hypothetical protein
MMNEKPERAAGARPERGILAEAASLPGRSTHVRIFAENVSHEAAENALRGVEELFDVLRLNQIPTGRLRLIYENAILHCERRADGACLGILSIRDDSSYDPKDLDGRFVDFQSNASAV